MSLQEKNDQLENLQKRLESERHGSNVNSNNNDPQFAQVTDSIYKSIDRGVNAKLNMMAAEI